MSNYLRVNLFVGVPPWHCRCFSANASVLHRAGSLCRVTRRHGAAALVASARDKVNARESMQMYINVYHNLCRCEDAMIWNWMYVISVI